MQTRETKAQSKKEYVKQRRRNAKHWRKMLTKEKKMQIKDDKDKRDVTRRTGQKQQSNFYHQMDTASRSNEQCERNCCAF